MPVSESSNDSKAFAAKQRRGDLAELKERLAACRERVKQFLALEPRQVTRLILGEAVDDLTHVNRCLEGVDLEQQPQFLRVADRLLQFAEWRLSLAEETGCSTRRR
jgi:hypothetical protein